MTKLIRIDSKNGVKEILEEALSLSEHFDGVIVIALNKDSTQWLSTSNMNGMQKAFLIQFAQSYMMNWFHNINVVDKGV